jgi:hypothetical protein
MYLVQFESILVHTVLVRSVHVAIRVRCNPCTLRTSTVYVVVPPQRLEM